MKDWLPLRAGYLNELLHHDGLRENTVQRCKACVGELEDNAIDEEVDVTADKSPIPDALLANIRCLDCVDNALYCRACTIKRHREHPLHWLQVYSMYSII